MINHSSPLRPLDSQIFSSESSHRYRNDRENSRLANAVAHGERAGGQQEQEQPPYGASNGSCDSEKWPAQTWIRVRIFSQPGPFPATSSSACSAQVLAVLLSTRLTSESDNTEP